MPVISPHQYIADRRGLKLQRAQVHIIELQAEIDRQIREKTMVLRETFSLATAKGELQAMLILEKHVSRRWMTLYSKASTLCFELRQELRTRLDERQHFLAEIEKLFGAVATRDGELKALHTLLDRQREVYLALEAQVEAGPPATTTTDP